MTLFFYTLFLAVFIGIVIVIVVVIIVFVLFFLHNIEKSSQRKSIVMKPWYVGDNIPKYKMPRQAAYLEFLPGVDKHIGNSISI